MGVGISDGDLITTFPPTPCPFWGTLVRTEEERVRGREEERRTWGGIIKITHQATQKTEPESTNPERTSSLMVREYNSSYSGDRTGNITNSRSAGAIEESRKETCICR